MALLQAFQHDIKNNPIAWREQIMLKRWRGKWFWRVLFGILIFLFMAPIFVGATRHYYKHLNFWLSWLVFANVIFYLLVSIRALTTASESVSRERNGKTWELLMLTGVSAWQVVLGKWVGIMRHMAKDFAWLYALRVVTIFWAVMSNNLIDAYGRDVFPYTGQSIYIWNTPLDVNGYFWLALGIIFIFTVLELAFSTALGIATAFFNFRGRVTVGLALIIRITLAIGLFLGVALVSLLAKDPNTSYSDTTVAFLSGLGATFIDNGMISNAAIALSEDYDRTEFLMVYALIQVLALALYISLTVFALNVARMVAARTGVANTNTLPEKTKRKRTHAPQREWQKETLQLVDLPDAKNHNVEVFQYNRRIGRLTLRLINGSKVLYTTFANVQYFDAPSTWHGAKFTVASSIDYATFIKERDLTTNSLLKDVLHLYQVEGNAAVNIIASTAIVSEELPRGV